MIGQRWIVGLAAVACAGLLAAAGGCAKPPEPPPLPLGADTAIRAGFYKAEIEDVEIGSQGGARLYEAELTYEGREVEVEVTPDGMIAQIEREVTMAEVPPAVADAITRAAGDGKIEEIERTEVFAVGQEGQVVPLTPTKVFYEAEFEKGCREYEVRVAPDGTVLGTESDD